MKKLGTHCRRGHEMTPENIYVPAGRPGSRECRPCKLAAAKESARRIVRSYQERKLRNATQKPVFQLTTFFELWDGLGKEAAIRYRESCRFQECGE